MPPASAIACPPTAEPEHQPESANQQRGSEERPLQWFIRPDWVIVWVTIAYTAVSGLTWTLIKEQAGQMRRQTQILEESVSVAEKAAVAAKITADTAVGSERAWLIDGISKMEELPRSFLTPVSCEITIANLGRVVARISRIQIRFHLVSSLEKESMTPSPEYNPQQRFLEVGKHGLVVAPGQIINFPCALESGTLNGEQSAGLRGLPDGEMKYWLILYERVTYHDGFTEGRTTQFSYRWIAPDIDPIRPPGFCRIGLPGYIEAS